MSLLSRAGFRLVGKSKAGKPTFRGPGASKPVSETTARRLATGSGRGSPRIRPAFASDTKKLPPTIRRNLQSRLKVMNNLRTDSVKRQASISKRITKLESRIEAQMRKLKSGPRGANGRPKVTASRVNQIRRFEDARKGLKAAKQKQKKVQSLISKLDLNIREIGRILR